MKSLSDPAELKPIDKADALLQVVIETPAKSRNKFAFDREQGIFSLTKVLPSGMVFPYDFGFVPRTKAGDGDPIDVLVLMDEPAFPGCALLVRLLGVIEGEQTTPKTPPVRNDRLIAVAETTHMYAPLQRLKDMPDQVLNEIE